MARRRLVRRLCLAVAITVAGGCQTHQRLVRQDENVVLGDLRTVITAQAAYEAVNAGFPDTLQCLAAPKDCIPGYPPDSPPFLSATMAGLTPENGYVRAFHPGPPAPTARYVPHVASPSSLAAWAYTAVPSRDRRGRKSFCADSTGRICATVDGSPPIVVDGQCASPCERVQ
jgi:hypothetical protein